MRELVSAKEAAGIIGVTVGRVYGILDLKPAHDKPRLYLRADVEALAAEYQPIGRTGQRRRVLAPSEI